MFAAAAVNENQVTRIGYSAIRIASWIQKRDHITQLPRTPVKRSCVLCPPRDWASFHSTPICLVVSWGAMQNRPVPSDLGAWRHVDRAHACGPSTVRSAATARVLVRRTVERCALKTFKPAYHMQCADLCIPTSLTHELSLLWCW